MDFGVLKKETNRSLPPPRKPPLKWEPA